MKRQTGFSTLAITLVLLLALTIVAFFTAYSVINHQKTGANTLRTQHAFDAAQAGLDYGITYLNQNQTTVTDGMVLTGTLANNSTYNIVYTFQGSSELIQIKSTGTSADGTATNVVQQLMKYFTLLGNIQTLPIKSRGAVELRGNTVITNTENGNTVITGDDVDFTLFSRTVLSGGISSYNGNIESDIVQNDAGLNGMSNEEFQTAVLGRTISSFQNFAGLSFNKSSSYDYSADLNGKEGTTIWISQTNGTAEISGNTTIGSPSNPVNLVVDGNLELSNQVTIYGNVIVSGNIQMTGTGEINGLLFSGGSFEAGVWWWFFWGSDINGAVATYNTLELRGNSTVTYDSTILESTAKAGASYGKVAGSWTDLNP